MNSKLDKYDMLTVRACKACRGDELFRRLRKIYGMGYLTYPSDVDNGDLFRYLLDIVCMIHPMDVDLVRFASYLGDSRVAWQCGAVVDPMVDPLVSICDFYTNGVYQLTSKIRLTTVDILPDDYIKPLKFKNK